MNARLRLLRALATAAVLGTVGTLSATVALPGLFGPNLVLQRDKPIHIWGTAAVAENVTVELRNPDRSVRLSASATPGSDGRWSVTLPAQSASVIGSPLSLRVAGSNEIVLDPVQIGEVWLCSGQSNMNFLMRPYSPFSEGVLDWENEVAAATDPGMAVFTTTPEANDTPFADPHGAWRPTTPTYTAFTSAVPFYVGKQLRDRLGIPVGIIVSALGGTSIKSWAPYPVLQSLPAAASFLSLHSTRRTQYATAIATYKQSAVEPYRELALQKLWTPTYATSIPDPEGYPTWRHQPAGLYNAMIAPLAAFPVRGFVWYQGEGDAVDHVNYSAYLEGLITGWRSAWGDSAMPFLIVQLANYDQVQVTGTASYTDNWANLREQQQRVADRLPNTGIAVAADVGASLTIHPRDKLTVGARLALAARRIAYGESSLVCAGPRFESLAVKDNQLTVLFRDETGSLSLDLTRATGAGPSFQLAGPDGVFYAATPSVDGLRVTLTAPEVREPRRVRYGFHNDPKLILYNSAGLPAPPFSAAVPTKPLASLNFTSGNVSVNDADTASATLALGAAITNTTYAAIGLPEPSLTIATHLTPASVAAAIDAQSFVEFTVTPVNAHRLLLAGATLQFDIARSTSGADFGYAVRWNLDNFARDLATATLTQEANVFEHVEVSVDGAEPALGAPLSLRVYLWDGLTNSARYVHLDNLTLHANYCYEPGLTIATLDNQGTFRLQWSGVPGRRYRVHRAPTLSTPFPVSASNLLCPPEGKLTYDLAFVGPQEFYNVSEQPQ